MNQNRFNDIAIDLRFKSIIGAVRKVASDRDPWEAVFVDEEWNVVRDDWAVPDARPVYVLPGEPPLPSFHYEPTVYELQCREDEYRRVYANNVTHYVVYQKQTP